MKPYIIVSPPYTPTSGGIKVMWALYGHLLARGIEVYMNQIPNNINPKDTIAVYPEIQNGNPVGTENIVRYVLAPPGEMGAVDQFGGFHSGPLSFPGEMVYYFSRLFGKVHNRKYLFLPAINTYIFTDYGQKRTKSCFLVGKGRNRNKHPSDAIELNREIAKDQKALADFLNECQMFYCYDKRTAMMECARLCGCPVMYYGEHTEEELKNYEPGLNGIGFNGKERKLDSEGFRLHYIELKREFGARLNWFIKDTQK